MSLYTKNGRPLQTSGDIVYNRSGTVVGRISGSKVYGTNGRYVGTIDGDRLVYRSTDSASIGSPFSAAGLAGSATRVAPGRPFGVMNPTYQTKCSQLAH
jgi:hypothetical protein